MMTVSYLFGSPVHLTLAAATANAHSKPSAAQALSREEIEERRWQLEWERRNVED